MPQVGLPSVMEGEEQTLYERMVEGSVCWDGSNSRQPVKASIHRAFPLVFS